MIVAFKSGDQKVDRPDANTRMQSAARMALPAESAASRAGTEDCAAAAEDGAWTSLHESGDAFPAP